MNDKDNRYNRIRYLVERWYDGSTSPEEEGVLHHLLTSTSELPEDLQEDRRLICGLNDMALTEIEMPDEYAQRINTALEREMRPKGIFRPRRLWWAAASVAVLVLAGVSLYRWSDTGSQNYGEGLMSKMSIALPAIEEDTLLKTHSLELSANKSGHIAYISSVQNSNNYGVLRSTAEAKGSESSTEKKLANRKPSTSPTSKGDEYEDDRSTRELEERLSRSNYRVIRSEEEADAILNSVFGVLEANIEMEKSKVNKITLDYDSQMINLFDTDEVNIHKTQYHEQTPI